MSYSMLVDKEDYLKLLHQHNELLELVNAKVQFVDELFELIKKKMQQ